MEFIFDTIKAMIVIVLLISAALAVHNYNYMAELKEKPAVAHPIDMTKCKNVVPRPVEHTIWGDISTGSDCAD